MSPKQELTFSITASVLFHLALLFILLFSFIDKQYENPPPEETYFPNIELVSDASTEEDVKDERQLVDISLVSEDASGETCTEANKTYTGIGIIYSTYDNTILNAPMDYPAGKAGIRQGDVVMSSKDNDGYRDIVVMRDRELHKFHLKMQPICYHE